MGAAELGLLALSQLQKLAEFQLNSNPNLPGSWMWNSKQSMASQEDDDSWEVRAFAEDTGNIMGTTWPPRSYTCTFCRREFRSAQALGGHMNVHRRDRARLHQTQPNSKTAATSSSSTLLIPTQELVANGGLCLLYSLPSPNGLFRPSSLHNCIQTPSTLLSITPYPAHSLMPTSSPHPPQVDFPVAGAAPHSIDTSQCQSSYTEASASIDNDDIHDSNNKKKDSVVEELDLELRLGRSS